MAQLTNGDAGLIRIVDPNLRHGFAQVPRPVLKCRYLSDKAKVVYALLLDYAWQEGSCYPGQARLAADLATTERTIRRALDELRSYGFIAWKRRGMQRTNVYFILSLAGNPYVDTAPSERTISSGLERTDLTGQDRTNSSPPERTPVTGNQYSGQKNASNGYPDRGPSLRSGKSRRNGKDEKTERTEPPEAPYLTNLITDLSAEFGDDRGAKSNVTQAVKLWLGSGLSEDDFCDLVYDARKTARATAGVTNRMAYCFGILRNLVGET